MQDNHGPFNAATAPTGTAWPAGDDTPSRTHDHWRHLLGFGDGDGDGDGDGKTTLQHINEFKAEHGEAAYVQPGIDQTPGRVCVCVCVCVWFSEAHHAGVRTCACLLGDERTRRRLGRRQTNL